MRPASTAAIGLLAVAAMALGAAVAYVTLRDDDPPAPATIDRSGSPTSPGTGDTGDLERDIEDAIADRLVDRLAAQSGVRVSPDEGRCLTTATLDVLGIDRLAEAVRTGQGVGASPAEESALLRAVVVCVDADRASQLLQIPTATIPGVPLPGDEQPGDEQ